MRRFDGQWREWKTRNPYHISPDQNEDCRRAYRSNPLTIKLEKCDQYPGK